MNDMAPAGRTKARKPLWRRIWTWTVRVVIGLVLLAVAIRYAFDWYATRLLNEEIAKIRAAGQPLTFAELARSMGEVPPEQDAAPYYAAALDLVRVGDDPNLWERVEDGFREAEKADQPPSSELLAQAERLLTANHLTLEMLDHATVLPGCTHHAGVTQGGPASTGRLSRARRAAKLCCLRAEILAYQGKGDKAAESAIALLRMGRISERHPTLIASLVRFACNSLCVNKVPGMLRYGRPSEKGLEGLSAALLQAARTYDLAKVYVAERAYDIAVSREYLPRKTYITLLSDFLLSEEDYIGAPEPVPYGPLGWLAWWGEPVPRMWLANLLRTHSRMIEAAGKPWPEIPEAMKEVTAESRSPFLNMMGAILAPSRERAGLVIMGGLAGARCAYVAVMIERYERAKHKLPDGLADVEAQFGVKMPSDPFTGNPLIYRKRDRGYVVYSVGQDKKDDGGEELAEFDSGDYGLVIRH